VLGDGEIKKCSDASHLNDAKINFYFLSFLVLPNSDMNCACPEQDFCISRTHRHKQVFL
jgi:hypothetical protein